MSLGGRHCGPLGDDGNLSHSVGLLKNNIVVVMHIYPRNSHLDRLLSIK